MLLMMSDKAIKILSVIFTADRQTWEGHDEFTGGLYYISYDIKSNIILE